MQTRGKERPETERSVRRKSLKTSKIIIKKEEREKLVLTRDYVESEPNDTER